MNKKIIYAILLSLGLAGCSDEQLDSNSVVAEQTITQTETDRWIAEHLTATYNVEVRYRSDKGNMQSGDYAPKTEKVLDVLKTIKALWMDVYASVGETHYLKDKMPLHIHLIGGRKLDSRGQELIANPDATGVNMYIYNVNDFDPKNADDVFCLMRSVHFQFAKRLLELKGYDRDQFLAISRHRYAAMPQGVHAGTSKATRRAAFDVSSVAAKRGCYSMFGLSSAEDDMADMISVLLTHKPVVEQEQQDVARQFPDIKEDPDYTRQLEQEGAQCADEMARKMAMLKDFFKNRADINLNRLQLASIAAMMNYPQSVNP